MRPSERGDCAEQVTDDVADLFGDLAAEQALERV